MRLLKTGNSASWRATGACLSDQGYAIDCGIDIDWSCCFCCLSIAPNAQLPYMSVWLLQLIGDNPQSTIPDSTEIAFTLCLLFHVLCKPTRFFFQLFITTMHNTVQTRFNSVLEDWPNKCHVWGFLQGQTRDN